MRVLIVEDEPDLREALAELLVDAGHECVEASDVEAARRQLTEGADWRELVDAVLVDLHLPGAPAETLVEELTRRGVFTILTSADTTAKSRAIAQRWSVRLVTKPFDVEELLRLLDAHVTGVANRS